MAYRIEETYDENSGPQYALVDEKGNAVADLKASVNDNGDILGFGILTGGSGASGSDDFVPINLDAINARAEQGVVPFGTGMGPALGYEYGMENSEGDIFRKFDAQGNLTEFLDKDGKFQPASMFKPAGLEFNASLGNFETVYKSPDSPRLNLRESNATSVNPYHEDQGGFLGEGGWGNIAKLALTGLTAGFAAPAMGAISGATGLGAVGSGAIYGGLTGAAGGLLGGGGLQGALKSGALGAAGGAIGGYLSGGDVAQAMPVDAPNANFTGMDINNPATWGAGEFQPFVGGDVGLGSEMITQFNPDGTFGNVGAVASDTIPEFGDVPTYDFDASAVDVIPEFGDVPTYDFNQSPGFLDTAKDLLTGDYGNLIKGGLAIGGLAVADALKPEQEANTAGGSLTAAQLQALVDALPSMIDLYSEQAQQAGAGSMNQGYTPAVSQAIAQLFPTFSLPTQGPFYGAGRFGEGYAPNAPIIQT